MIDSFSMSEWRSAPSARTATAKTVCEEIRQAKLPMILYERKLLDEEGATRTPGHKGSERNLESAESVGDHWGGAGICGCRSPGYLAAHSPKQQT